MAGALERSTRDLTEKCTVENAKRLAFPLLAVILSLHGLGFYFSQQSGYDTCDVLLTTGYYLTPKQWQPKGCMMHKYKAGEIGRCLQNQRVAFIGDSRVRQLYNSFLTEFTGKEFHDAIVHSDLSHTEQSTNTFVEFRWQPHINDSTIDLYQTWISGKIQKPNLIIHGAATWAIKDFKGEFSAIEQYKTNLSKVALQMDTLNKDPDVKIVWILQAPVVEPLLSGPRKVITNNQIDLYNDVAYAQFRNSDIQVWQSVRKTAYFSQSPPKDGLHVPDDVIETNCHLLLNWFCNKDIDPADATCCKGLPFPLTLHQKTLIIFFTFCFFGSLFMFTRVKKKHVRQPPDAALCEAGEGQLANGQLPNGHVKEIENRQSEEMSSNEELYNTFVALTKFGVILAYFYICDRTDLIPKEQKHFSYLQFFVAFAYIAVVGFFFDRETKQPTLLNRDQTEEWKGWMQLVILIYHVTGASTVLPIYMHVRILVAMYLFQTGYGHFSFFWKKGEFGIVRVCQVMFRLNFLVFFLCLAMDRPYQFYYFVPLVSFWFVVVYVVMVIPPRATVKTAAEHPTHYLLMTVKLAALFTVCALIGFSEVLFQNMFNWWPMVKLFAWPGTSLHEWWFRWQLDRYVVGYGMFFAFAYISLSSMGKIKDNNPANLFSPILTAIIVIGSILAIVVYTVHAFTCSTKPECNEVHTLLSLLPVTGFILLRNVPGYFRTKYSSFFAWFGKISLELFIGQYHIWLANDTKGILVLVPHYPTLNKLVSSFIFVCIAHEITSITTTVTKWAVPNNTKVVLRRFFLFCAMLVLLLLAGV
ncbi:N-acetylneuraminate 9-O-acetyltransferase-like isoform X3 [Anneissia japonica]|uniref:N-acetylneuraminate 9-O-acetyltransferase-like isoform X1 n=1 Tax=Anneissia japonica TaxID=1529436 RepID=UPI0014258F3C|nr:N-acetylneuraminate 9-O-acetyltransferase-like isoform X1 [Anneissia japonica]XP_033102446.1 N-acetylneuraminate 9-O-acetyltransferase-like isoform X2 [Anneissia japonica]XP_033102447.1 N-acetylneuraminate 9-O-acetyltransferase-like isoform X3 [Anneissia japonica]